MQSLRDILALHTPILALDSASLSIQVGWIDSSIESKWTSSNEESGVGLFRCIESLGRPVSDAAAFVYCDGPGSILGVRTSAMALRTWNALTLRPVYAFHSLSLVANTMSEDVAVIADARRDQWHMTKRGGTLCRVPGCELHGPVVMPEGFRTWSTLPVSTSLVPYSVSSLFTRAIDTDLFRKIESPDAFLHDEPSYVTWQPKVHRAP